MPRLIMISPEEGAEGLALLIAEIMIGQHAPDEIGVTEALAKLEEADADFAARARKAGKVIHQMLTGA